MLHPSSSIIWTCPHLLSKKRRLKQLSLVTSPMFLGAFSRSLVNWLGRLPFFCQLPLGGRTWGPSNLHFRVKLNVVELWENFENFEAAQLLIDFEAFELMLSKTSLETFCNFCCYSNEFLLFRLIESKVYCLKR
jgi:hypothetical protein